MAERHHDRDIGRMRQRTPPPRASDCPVSRAIDPLNTPMESEGLPQTSPRISQQDPDHSTQDMEERNLDGMIRTYKNKFHKVIQDILKLDEMEGPLNISLRNNRASLVSKRKSIEDMIDSLTRQRGLQDISDQHHNTKYTPDYPSFDKGGVSDIKNPLLFSQALRIALRS